MRKRWRAISPASAMELTPSSTRPMPANSAPSRRRRHSMRLSHRHIPKTAAYHTRMCQGATRNTVDRIALHHPKDFVSAPGGNRVPLVTAQIGPPQVRLLMQRAVNDFRSSPGMQQHESSNLSWPGSQVEIVPPDAIRRIGYSGHGPMANKGKILSPSPRSCRSCNGVGDFSRRIMKIPA